MGRLSGTDAPRAKISRLGQGLAHILEQAEVIIDRMVDNTGMAALNEFVQTEVAPRIRKEVSPKIRQYLVSNLDRSGIQTRTGKLRSAIQASDVLVGFNSKTGSIFLTIQMPRDLPDYEYTGQPKYKKDKKGANFYNIVQGLHSGSVRPSRGASIDKSTKSAIKQQKSATGALQVRRRSQQRGTVRQKTDEGKQVAIVTPGRGFYRLSTSQANAIGAEVERILNEELAFRQQAIGA